MGYPIYHSAYTAAQIEASLGKAPRINATNHHWEVWDIATSAYVDTGVVAESEEYAAQAEAAATNAGAAESAANRAVTAAVDAKAAAQYAQSKSEIAQGKAEDAQTAAETAASSATTILAAAVLVDNYGKFYVMVEE